MRQLGPPSEWIVTLRSGDRVTVWADSVTGLSGADDTRDYSFENLVEASEDEQLHLEIAGRAPNNPQRVVTIVARFPRESVESVLSGPGNPGGEISIPADALVLRTQQDLRYRNDARTLGQIGASLVETEFAEVEVHLPAQLARVAVEAWERDEADIIGSEDTEQRLARNRAGALALIGLAIAERGKSDGSSVVVRLSSDLVTDAIRAFDDPAAH